MNQLKAVFWDVDGTIADTELHGHREAFNQAFLEAGIPWHWDIKTYIELLEISGGFNRIKYFSGKKEYIISDNNIKILHQKKQIHYSKILESGKIPLRNGVSRLISELKANAISQFIVTTSSKLAIDSLFKSTLYNHRHDFVGIISYEDVTLTKPNPEGYLKAINKLSIPVQNCIAIEDSLIGLQAAISSGLCCVVNNLPWNDLNIDRYKIAQSVIDNLGDQDTKPSVLLGPPLTNNLVDLNYLIQLIN
mgnify:CR=1 FL=1|tara:strand:+ start:2272 stop:3018 length:747 start_codon:yes stop_codon:yes gene_type:complete